MSNNQLPAEVRERIQKDADKFSYMGLFNGKHLRNDDKLKGYIAGATAVHEKVQVLVDVLTAIANGCATPQYRAISALQQWRGKEVENEM